MGVLPFYKKEIFIGEVDKQDNLIGPVERWKARRENILHRAISVVLYFENGVFVQQRKHPLFDGYFDITIASHQIYRNGTLENDIESVYANLSREWNVSKDDIVNPPKFLGKIYYRSKDDESEFHEQEYDYYYRVELEKFIVPNFDYCYGFLLLSLDEIKKDKYGILNHMSPWTKTAIEAGVL